MNEYEEINYKFKKGVIELKYYMYVNIHQAALQHISTRSLITKRHVAKYQKLVLF